MRTASMPLRARMVSAASVQLSASRGPEDLGLGVGDMGKGMGSQWRSYPLELILRGPSPSRTPRAAGPQLKFSAESAEPVPLYFAIDG